MGSRVVKGEDGVGSTNPSWTCRDLTTKLRCDDTAIIGVPLLLARYNVH